ncbi:MAG: RNA methyltransferase [Acidimicrobiales bacterium]
MADGVVLDAVFVEETAAETVGTGALVVSAMAAGIAIHVVADGALDRILDTVTSPGVAALAPLPRADLGDLAGADLVLVLAGVGDPGNAGTLLRTAEAGGAGGVVCTLGTVDPFAPKCVGAAAGAVLRVPIVTGVSAVEALLELGRSGHRRLGTVLHGGRPHDEVDLRGPIAVVLGNEAHGLPSELSQEQDDLLDELLTIPMAGPTQSLNVAMAGAVITFEALRQRRNGRDSTGTPDGR